MRFEGRFNKRHLYDWAAYYRDLYRLGPHMVSASDYMLNITYFTANVYGQFVGGICSESDPITIVEQPNGPERLAELRVSSALLERLKNDGETAEENLMKITAILENKE